MLAAFTAPGEELGSPKKRRKASSLSDTQEELALEAVGSLGNSLPRWVASSITCSSSLPSGMLMGCDDLQACKELPQ